MININEVDSIINTLQCEVSSQLDDDVFPVIFELHSNGLYITVNLFGQRIWDDDNDDRKYRDKTKDYEPLEPYLRKKANKLFKKLKGLKL